MNSPSAYIMSSAVEAFFLSQLLNLYTKFSGVTSSSLHLHIEALFRRISLRENLHVQVFQFLTCLSQIKASVDFLLAQKFCQPTREGPSSENNWRCIKLHAKECLNAFYAVILPYQYIRHHCFSNGKVRSTEHMNR